MSNDHGTRITALEQEVQEVKSRLSTLEEITAPRDVEGMSNYILGVAMEEQCKETLRNRTISPTNTHDSR